MSLILSSLGAWAIRALVTVGGLWLIFHLRYWLVNSGARVFWLTTLATVVLLRGAHLLFLARGLADERRSLIIGGYQIHHLMIGVLLAGLTWLLFTTLPSRLSASVFPVLFGVSVGLVFDEAAFMILTPATDMSYMGFVSLLGVITLYFLLWFSITPSCD